MTELIGCLILAAATAIILAIDHYTHHRKDTHP